MPITIHRNCHRMCGIKDINKHYPGCPNDDSEQIRAGAPAEPLAVEEQRAKIEVLRAAREFVTAIELEYKDVDFYYKKLLACCNEAIMCELNRDLQRRAGIVTP